MEIPDPAAKYPSKQVGDYLYEYCIEQGLTQYLIAWKNKEGHCWIVDYGQPKLFVACEGYHLTPQDAIREELTEFREHMRPRLVFARKALEKLETGDLDGIVGGFNALQG